MPDYSRMYRELFGAVTKAMEGLQQAQIKTGEMYISDEAPALSILESETDSGGTDKSD